MLVEIPARVTLSKAVERTKDPLRFSYQDGKSTWTGRVICEMPYRAISMQSNPAGDELRDMIEGIAAATILIGYPETCSLSFMPNLLVT